MTNRELKIGGHYLIMVERRLHEVTLTQIERGRTVRHSRWTCRTNDGQTFILRSIVQFKGVVAPRLGPV